METKNPQIEALTIFVNPIPGRISAQGRHKQVFTVPSSTGEAKPTVTMGKTKEFGTASEYSFQFNPSTQRLVTGLDKPIENPFKGLKPHYIIESYGLSQDWLPHLQTIVEQEMIKLQTKYEIMDNVAYNTYTSAVAGNQTIYNSMSAKVVPVTPNFLQRFKIILYDGPNRFTDETSRGRLSIALIKNHTKIAKNRSLMNPAVHDWFISQEDEAVMEKSKKRNIIGKAIAKWQNIQDNATPYLVYQVASLLTNNDNNIIVKGKMKDITVKDIVSDYLYDSNNQMDNIAKFTKVSDLTNDKDGLKKLHVKYLIQQALNHDVMKVRDGYYIWNSRMGVADNVYKNTDYDKFVNLIMQEMINLNPKDTSTNHYRDLLTEVKEKGAWVE